MPDYSKGKIYTIRCRTDDGLIYVGSTIQPLSVRFANHKIKKDISLYQYIEKHCDGNWSNWYIELFELCPCNSKEELHKREGEIQRQIATINRCIAGRTKREYYRETIETRREYENNYRTENNEILKSKKKVYYETNKETILEGKKVYYQNNKTEILEKNKAIVLCECGCNIGKLGLSRHQRTKKHLDLFAALAPTDIQSNIPILPE